MIFSALASSFSAQYAEYRTNILRIRFCPNAEIQIAGLRTQAAQAIAIYKYFVEIFTVTHQERRPASVRRILSRTKSSSLPTSSVRKRKTI